MKKRAIWMSVVLVGTLAGGIVTWGCGAGKPLPAINTTIQPGKDRGRQLIALAATEAAKIADVDTRLTRLLNLADLQIQRGWKTDAPRTLGDVVVTLRSKDAMQLSEQARISGWVSVSQLSRSCDDVAQAQAACDGALAAMRAIEEPARRCEYVIGVCNEIQYLKGKPAAVSLLAEAGPWSRSIDDVQRRRQAVVAFASALFNLDDFAAGQKMIQFEEDAAWRSATLTQLATMAEQNEVKYKAVRMASDAGAASAATDQRAMNAPSTPSAAFGRELDYIQIFKGQRNSQTVKDPIGPKR